MIVYCIWVIWKGERTPSLWNAWDDHSVNENMDGWEELIQKAKYMVADGEIDDFRVIRFTVYSDEIENCFKMPTMIADIEREVQR